MRTTHFSSFVAIFTFAGAAVWSGCGPDDSKGRDAQGGSGGDTGTGGTVRGSGGSISGEPWPADPIIDAGAPADAASKFAATPGGAGPCISEPQDGAMLPRNWLRPRFRITPGAGENLFQITL